MASVQLINAIRTGRLDAPSEKCYTTDMEQNTFERRVRNRTSLREAIQESRQGDKDSVTRHSVLVQQILGCHMSHVRGAKVFPQVFFYVLGFPHRQPWKARQWSQLA